MLSDKHEGQYFENNSSSQIDTATLTHLAAQLEAGLEAQKADRAEIARLQARLASQETELETVRQQLETKRTSRRRMLRRVGGAAAGLAAFTLAAPAMALAASDPAIQADGATDGYGAAFSGGLAQVRLVPGAASGRTSGTHAAGELYSQDDGTLWYYTGTSWLQLGGGGGFTYLTSPIRVIGDPNPNFANTFPTITAGTPRTFRIEGNQVNGAYTANIPASAGSIIGSLVVFGATETGYLTVYPADQPSAPPIATVTYGPGLYVSTAFTTKLGVIASGADAGKKGINISTFKTCQISLDVAAYGS